MLPTLLEGIYWLVVTAAHAYYPVLQLKFFVCIYRYLYCTVCPTSFDPNHTITYYIKWIKTSWTDSKAYKQNQRLYLETIKLMMIFAPNLTP